MNGIESINSINEGNTLFRRARNYCQNHPGIGIDNAIAILTKADAGVAKSKRVKKSLNTAKRGK